MAKQTITGGNGTTGQTGSEVKTIINENFTELYTAADAAGDVSGPASSTDGNLPSFSGTGGKTLQDSGLNAGSFIKTAGESTLTDDMTLTGGDLSLQFTSNGDGLAHGGMEFGIGYSPSYFIRSFDPFDANDWGEFAIIGNNISFSTKTNSGAELGEFVFQAGTAVYSDSKTTKDGIKYAASGYVTNARSLTDKGYVDGAITSALTPYVTLTGTETLTNKTVNTVTPSEFTEIKARTLLTQTTGTVVSYTAWTWYGTPASPESGNITESLTSALAGLVQRMYHNNGTEPTYPAGWVQVGTGTYSTGNLNIIHFMFISGTRVEYWITQ